MVIANRNLVRILVTAAIALCLTACDPALEVRIRNGLSRPVRILFVFEGDKSMSGDALPGTTIVIFHPPSDFVSATVYSGGVEVNKLDRASLIALKPPNINLKEVTWNIEHDGIRPMTPLEVKQLDEAKN